MLRTAGHFLHSRAQSVLPPVRLFVDPDRLYRHAVYGRGHLHLQRRKLLGLFGGGRQRRGHRAKKSFLPHRRPQAALGAPDRFGRIAGCRRRRRDRAPSDGGADRRAALAQRLQRRIRHRGLPAVRRVYSRQMAVKGAGVSRSILGADVPHPLRAQQLCAADHLSDPYRGGGLLHLCRRDAAFVDRGALSEKADPI